MANKKYGLGLCWHTTKKKIMVSRYRLSDCISVESEPINLDRIALVLKYHMEENNIGSLEIGGLTITKDKGE